MRLRCASFVGVVGIAGADSSRQRCAGRGMHEGELSGSFPPRLPCAHSRPCLIVNLVAGARSRAARARAGAVLCASASASGVVWAYCGQSGASCGLLRVRGTGGEVGLPLAHLSAASVGRGRA